MKHSIKVTALLLGMFFLTQLIGLAVLSAYSPQVKQITDKEGNVINITSHNLPYGTEPPQNINPKVNLISIVIALFIAISLMLLLMKFKAEIILRTWFFFVITLAIAITLNSAMLNLQYSSLLAFIIALPLAFLKVFRRNIFVHNATELIIYPGIAAIFVPLLNIWTIILLLIFISIYDMYAVWHSGFMQKMAKYQIKTLRIFSGFFIPYITKKQGQLVEKLKKASFRLKNKKVKVHVAILGGGDIIFPIILAGVVLRALGPLQAVIISLGATLALAALFYFSEKGKFYPAMPFITAGCFIALAISFLV